MTVLTFLTVPVLSLTLLDLLPTAQASAASWAARLTEGQVHQQVRQISLLSGSEQRALFARLTHREQSQWWAEELSRFDAEHPALNDDQRSILDQARRMLSEAFFANPRSFRDQNARLLKAIAQHFTPEEQRELMISPAADHSVLASLARPAAWLRSHVVAMASGKCTCIQERDPCGSGTYCSANVECEIDPGNCYIGWFQWGDCYGLCVPNP
ncbi:MAG TPA: bacteriocin fulvocin C-related protein [Vicinamibacterales bacterium]|nr:bacteriocin fulvocin C-related protein [Vicinamibacterales bacterium]